MPRVSVDVLERFGTTLLKAAQVPSRDAEIVVRHLVHANLAGHDSHGVLRLPQYLDAVQRGHVRLGVRPRLLREGAATANLDGQRGFGQVAAAEAMAVAIRKSRETGVAVVTLRNCYHSGRIGSYSCQAAEAGLVGIVMVNAGGGGQSVAPFGGIERRLATNPLSIAIPSRTGAPLFLDIATSVAPEGKVRDYFQRGKPVPEGWISDSFGRATTDPRAFYAKPGGALLPFGGAVGYKGFGLAVMIDIIAGALSGAGTCRADAPEPSDGLFMLALEVERFVPRADFDCQVEQLIAHVKSSRPAPGFTEIFFPGELEHREQKRRLEVGVDIDKTTWELILEAGRKVGVSPPNDLGVARQGSGDHSNPKP